MTLQIDIQDVREQVMLRKRVKNAFKVHDFDTVRNYCKQIMDVNFPLQDELLWRACQSDNIEGLKWLFAQGVNVNARDGLNLAFDSNVLSLVARKGNIEMLQLLLDAGANVNATNKFGMVPALESIMYIQKDAFHLLMNAGTDINLLFDNQIECFSHFNQPFILAYIEEHKQELTPKNEALWKNKRLKMIFN